MKKLGIVFLILAAVGITVWQAGLLNFDLNAFIKQQIETHGTKAVGTKVGVMNVSVELKNGKGAISGLTIANPKGYKSVNAFEMNEVLLDLGTNGYDPIVIEELLIDSPKLTYEATKDGGGNLLDIKELLAKGGSETAPSDSQPADLPHVSIKKITIKDVALAMDLTALTLKEYQEVLPSITITDIGGEAGIPVEQLGSEIGKKLFSALIDEVKKKQKAKLKDKVKDKLKDKVKDKLGDLFGS